MKVSNISKNIATFCATQSNTLNPDKKVEKVNPESTKDENPISKSGERAILLKTTAIAGLGLGGRLLWTLFEDGFVFEDLLDSSSKIVDKNKPNVNGTKKALLKLGAWGALIACFVGAVAAIYTLYKTPNIMYNGKVNAFKKGKDMDVYVKGNKVERELYDQMNEKAENATPEEKEELSKQYLKLKAAKNQIPESVQAQVNSKNY